MDTPITIRKTTYGDLPEILKIYGNARQFMIEHGNPTQWADGYPGEDLIRSDIDRGNSYVCLSEDRIVGTFAFLIGEDPTYQYIENGAWHWDTPYGTIHRVASSGTVRGIAAASFRFCAGKINHLRIDTHADNLQMQTAIRKFGFRPTGIIYVGDGTPRLAFDYLVKVSAN